MRTRYIVRYVLLHLSFFTYGVPYADMLSDAYSSRFHMSISGLFLKKKVSPSRFSPLAVSVRAILRFFRRDCDLIL
ncbi:hypothetical protein F4803DRAFT_501745 [Xylaria telfairii]|nr:hypothetical protein F4803DRAFT_501745 [Xylaria telfairii]